MNNIDILNLVVRFGGVFLIALGGFGFLLSQIVRQTSPETNYKIIRSFGIGSFIAGIIWSGFGWINQ